MLPIGILNSPTRNDRFVSAFPISHTEVPMCSTVFMAQAPGKCRISWAFNSMLYSLQLHLHTSVSIPALMHSNFMSNDLLKSPVNRVSNGHAGTFLCVLPCLSHGVLVCLLQKISWNQKHSALCSGYRLCWAVSSPWTWDTSAPCYPICHGCHRVIVLIIVAVQHPSLWK